MTPEEKKKKRSDYWKKYYAKNKEELSNKRKQYRIENGDEVRLREKINYHKNAERYKGYWKKYWSDKVRVMSDEQKTQAKSRRKNYRKNFKKWINDQKYPCIVCGEDDPVVIDWHHVKPDTKTKAVSACTSMLEAEKEIEKCVCLCSNCHRRFHNGKINIGTYQKKRNGD